VVVNLAAVLVDDQAVPAFIALGLLVFFNAATFVVLVTRGGRG
jgi:hypothetical protein